MNLKFQNHLWHMERIYSPQLSCSLPAGRIKVSVVQDNYHNLVFNCLTNGSLIESQAIFISNHPRNIQSKRKWNCEELSTHIHFKSSLNFRKVFRLNGQALIADIQYIFLYRDFDYMVVPEAPYSENGYYNNSLYPSS